MRRFIARMVLAGIVGPALAGCGTTSGTAPPTGGFPNGASGGPVPIGSQNPPGGSVPSLLVDGGLLSSGAYLGFNASASDAQSANDAGPDVATPGSGKIPANPAGSHLIAFAGNGLFALEFLYGGTVPSLVEPVVSPGQVLDVTYGALVLFATVTNGATPPSTAAPTLAVELTGGSGSTTFDVRSACSATPSSVTPADGFTRYACPLPAYGTNSSTNLVDPIVPAATGSFTPFAPKLYVELIYPGATSSASSGNTLNLDFIYAEQGTK
ncbi:MAG: hypothetical protein ACREM2_10905 [Vulcanimicrobiaceae bacterium]